MARPGPQTRAPARDSPYMAGVGQDQREGLLEDVPDRLPVGPGGLHDDMGHVLGRQPVRKHPELPDRRLEGAAFLTDCTVLDSNAGHKLVLAQVERGAAWMHDIHSDLHPWQRRGVRTVRSLRNVLSVRGVQALQHTWKPSTRVRPDVTLSYVDSMGCSQDSGSN